MLLSFALILLLGLMLGEICSRLKLPALFGFMLTGIVLGPYVLNLIDPSILSVSADLRQIALIIILIRAGLNLDLESLKKVGRPAIMMCFVPATCEIIGMCILAPLFFHMNLLDSLILGTVIAAVSPAVVVPNMLKLMDEKYGTEEGIPQMIMAGASADDVFVIVLFSSFTSLAASGEFNAMNFLRIPTSILTGVFSGILVGWLLAKFFRRVHLRDTAKILILLSVSFLLVTLEKTMTGWFGYSGLLAIMAMGASFRNYRGEVSVRLSGKFSKLWVAAEIMLFVLVGAAVDLEYAMQSGITAIALIFCVVLFRMAGVWLCVLGTKLNMKERLFCMLAYTPKATVQAAIGSVPLAMGLACGNTVLIVAVTAILLTAPLGAFAINLTYRKWLKKAQ